jgi:very-short-patch-repair endonuclease
MKSCQACTLVVMDEADTGFDARRIFSRGDLLLSGYTAPKITEAVRSAELIRVRRDHYALPGTDQHTLEAVRVGGRLTCVSAARELGIFAFDSRVTHLHVPRSASRLRDPRQRRLPLAAVPRENVTVHWWPLIDSADGTEYCVGVRDALAHIIRCQAPNFALAALDTALHDAKIQMSELPDIFAAVPAKHSGLRFQIDARVDAGQETVLRRLILDAGMRCEIQVWIPGVGRVDMVVEECVVLEADSRAHHKSWPEHIRDRTRDRLLAERQYVSLRVLYQDIMFDPDGVIRAIRELVEICRNGSPRA